MLIDDRPAKILILGEARVPHAQRWAAHFRDRGCTTRWLSFDPIPADQWAESLGACRRYRALRILRTASRVRRLIADFTPDIVSALFVPDYGWLGALTKTVPLAVSVWGSDVLIAPDKSPVHRARVRYVLSHAAGVFADAEFLRHRIRTLGVDNERIAIVPLGVDDLWLRTGETRGDDTSSPIAIISNRRWEQIYRVETLVHAAAELHRAAPGRFRFIIIGEGSEESKLRNLTRQLEVEDIVQFQHWMPSDQLRAAFQISTVFVSASSSDGTSVSLLEAMAAGCCPIVTDIPGNREWIEHAKNGYLFDVGDSRSLARLIQNAVNAPEWITHVRQVNRTVIRERAMWQDNMRTVEEFMLGTIRKSRVTLRRGGS